MQSARQPDRANKSAPKVVMISGTHDYRTPRRGSFQALADAFIRLGYEVSFISIRFSPISIVTGDHRRHLWSRINQVEKVNNIQCYLWGTIFHPCHTRLSLIDKLATPLFSVYARLPARFLDNELRSASFIVLESGLAISLAHRARRLNKQARIIYRASDMLDTIGAHPSLKTELQNRLDDIDAFCLLAQKMARDFTWAAGKAYVVPLGINPQDFADIGPSPYSADKNAITVGSMLFDPEFFQYAARKFPDVQFHLIGCDHQFAAPSNVHIYKEMPFKDTLPYIKHADFGIAAYRPSRNSEYLSQSSLKLMQYDYLQIPAVCPDYAVGNSQNRFGYSPTDRTTIEGAIRLAMERRPVLHGASFLNWEHVAERMLHPEAFSDTAIAAPQADVERSRPLQAH